MKTHFFYKIHKLETDLCYIGRTRDPRSRLAVHRSKTATCDIPLYVNIRENGGWNDSWKFEILQTLECDTDKAIEIESQLCIEHDANLNTHRPNLTRDSPNYQREYYRINKDKLGLVAREKYQKTKKEWKCPKKTSSELKTIALNKAKRTGHIPTPFTCEKHSITDEELETALIDGGWIKS